MNVFIHELKAQRKATVIWTLAMAGLVVLFLSMFPSIAKEADHFQAILQGFPESVRAAIGLSLESMTSLLGFYAYSFTYIVLCGAIQAMILGTSVISKETNGKTADFLFSKPVSRMDIMTAKLLATLTSLTITSIGYIGVAVLTAFYVKNSDFKLVTFLQISFSLWLIQLVFLAIGIAVSVIVPRIKSTLAVSLGVVFSLFLLSMFSSATGDDGWRLITPFKWFDANDTVKNSGYQLGNLWLSFLFIGIVITASYRIYLKKDIKI